MVVLVTYDVSTVTRVGQKRLNKIAKACLNYGQRVQNSVFECNVDPAQWTALRAELMGLYAEGEDSLRFYYLGSNWQKRVEHHGQKKALDIDGLLLA